ncbi:MAG: efflux RND transporter permease subunit, partial [Candidatus Latescibacteria bacterium]|nr:efflux RND transporter permease subunit [Candidatus Latescibacterota bacterium]
MESDARGRVEGFKQDFSSTFEITTRRPVAIFMVVLAVAVFGYVSYQQLPLNMMPDISYPTLTVRTEYADTAPEEVENLISRPIEQRLGVVSNLVSITSISRPGLSDVILEFGWDTDMNDAVQTVRENLDRLNLPRGVNRPLILRYDPTQDPIMRVGIYGKENMYLLRQIAEEEIKQELEALKGVAAARVKGGLEEEIRIEISERQLSLMGMNISTINRRLQEENVNLAGGSLLDGQTQYLVRTLNEFRTIDEIANLVVGDRGGIEIRVKDVGKVTRTHKEREIITRVNGVESVEIEIFKEADANIVATAQRVTDRMFGTPEQLEYVAKLRGGKIEQAKANDRRAQVRQFVQMKEMTGFIAFSLPEGVAMELLSDQSTFIESSVNEVKQTALLGGFLAILVLYIFLRNPVHTAIVGLSIPISIVATFAPMNIFGVSLNIMSLGGLALGIGMLVDNAIVVLESIFRCREEGDDMVTATIRGTGEVGGAVFASTLTTVAVFFPIVFVEGVAGQIFGDMALTVVFSLLASLGVALFFIPMLASRQVRLGGADEGEEGRERSSGGLSEMTRSEVLQLHSVASLRQAAELRREGKIGNATVLGRAVLGFGWLLGEYVARVLWIACVAIVVALKAIVALLGVILFPIAWLGWGLNRWIRSGPKWRKALLGLPFVIFFPLGWLIRFCYRWDVDRMWAHLCDWADGRDLFGKSWVRVIWDDLLVFVTPQNLGEDLVLQMAWTWRAVKRLPKWVWKGSMFKRILKGVPGLLGEVGALLLFVLGPVYFVLRFVIFTTLMLVGKVLVLSLMLVFLTGLVALLLLAMIALPFLAPILFLFEHSFEVVRQAYTPFIRWALHNRLTIVMAAVLPFAFCWVVLLPSLGTELIPQVHQGEFNVDIGLPVGTPLEMTDETLKMIETRVMDAGDVGGISSAIGVDKTDVTSSDQGEHTGVISVVLQEITVDENENVLVRWGRDLVTLPARIWGGIRGESVLAQREDDLMTDLRDRLSDLPQVKADFSRPALFSFKTPIEVEIRGYDLPNLTQLGREAERVMGNIPGLYDVKSSLQRGNPEVQIVYNRDLLAKYNLNVRSVASLVCEKVQGNVVTRFREADRRIDVLVRIDESDRAGVSDLQRLVVNPGRQVPIRLSAVAAIEVHEGPSEIRRIDQQRAVLISANVSGVDLGTMTAMIQQALEAMEVPQDVSMVIGGQNKEMETSLSSLTFALGLAIFLVYIVMASQFESFLHPLVIMFTIPLALIGVIVVLFATGIPLSVVVFLGMIMLAGIVVNNAIVLVDYINHLRRTGLSKIEAIVQAGEVRLRPILMTTSTTV